MVGISGRPSARSLRLPGAWAMQQMQSLNPSQVGSREGRDMPRLRKGKELPEICGQGLSCSGAVSGPLTGFAAVLL